MTEPTPFWKGKKVCVTGGRGFLGSRVMDRLDRLGAEAVSCSRRSGCDLKDLQQGLKFFRQHRPEIVVNCAAHQGGIAYQSRYPADTYYDNLLMGANTMEAARLAGVAKYVNIVAGCAYPGEPEGGRLREDQFEAGPMHPSVENYGMTKRAAVMQARCYARQHGFKGISVVLINLYGPGEHFHPDRSHALAALLKKFYDAKRSGAEKVVLWGSGRPVREWLFVEDAAEGILRAAERYEKPEPINVATGQGHTIAELAEMIREIIGYGGRIEYDASRPDGALRKTGEITRMQAELDWRPRTPIREGIRKTLAWLEAHYDQAVAAEG
ncbi:MAG: epimerase [Candidatus Omnitrophica bacterium CG11_big_fil_rev_8_21_14_0_20_64_10]|nr:MAG: epimerase [Candidatus Omnitrophica bacterium CG11_big_fil_rev_8_21_14_0_20_64_10]